MNDCLTKEQKNYIYWLILEYKAKKDLLEDDELLVLDRMRDEMDIDTVEKSLLDVYVLIRLEYRGLAKLCIDSQIPLTSLE